MVAVPAEVIGEVLAVVVILEVLLVTLVVVECVVVPTVVVEKLVVEDVVVRVVDTVVVVDSSYLQFSSEPTMFELLKPCS